MRNKAKRVFTALLAVIAGALVGVVVPQSPAEAAYADCPPTQLCVWRWADYNGNNGNGRMYHWTPLPAGRHTQVEGSWNDDISSVRNRSSSSAVLYTDAGCSAGPFLRQHFPPGSSTARLFDIDNNVSCIRWG